MIEAHGKLVRIGHHRRGTGVGVDSVGAERIVGQRVAREYARYARIDRDRQHIAGKGGGVQAGAFLLRGHGKYLGRAQHLAKALVLAKVKGLAGAVVDAVKDDRAAIGEAKLVAAEGRKPARVGDARSGQSSFSRRRAELRRNSKKEPWKPLLPDRVTILVKPAAPRPISAGIHPDWD